MNGRLGIPAVLAVMMVVLIAVPAVPTDADVAGQSFYVSQLDDNGVAVYDEIADLKDTYTNIASVDVGLENLVLFEDVDSAMAYGQTVAVNAMAAAYYTEPMVVYLWDLPVRSVPVEVGTSQVTVTSQDSQKTYYVASSVSFQLEVPEDMKDDTATEANELQQRMDEVTAAISEIKVEGSVPDMAKALVDRMKKVKAMDDEEGKVSNIYDALVDKKASTAGVAAAYTAVAQANGMGAVTVKGEFWTPDSDESRVNYWNNVWDDGAWYAVDARESNKGGSGFVMAGWASDVEFDEKRSTFGVTNTPDLDLSADNTLKAPELSRDAYPYPVHVSFLDQYGSQIMMLIIGVVIVATLLYALKRGNL